MIKQRWPGFLLIAVILGFWEAASYTRFVDPVTLPRVSVILAAWLRVIESGVLIEHLGSSLARIFSGFALATLVAVPLGLLMGGVPFVYRLMEPITEFLRPIPSSAYIPVAILFLGIGDGMKVFVIFLACIFPILLNTRSGVRDVDAVLVDTGRTFGLSHIRSLQKIVFPAALPNILTGMRISLGIALIVVVIAEMIAGNTGIGFFILDMERIFRVPEMFAGIFTLGVLGFTLNLIFLRIERYLLRWRSP